MKGILSIAIALSILFSGKSLAKRESGNLQVTYNARLDRLVVQSMNDKDMRSVRGVEPVYSTSSLDEALDFSLDFFRTQETPTEDDCKVYIIYKCNITLSVCIREVVVMCGPTDFEPIEI